MHQQLPPVLPRQLRKPHDLIPQHRKHTRHQIQNNPTKKHQPHHRQKSRRRRRLHRPSLQIIHRQITPVIHKIYPPFPRFPFIRTIRHRSARSPLSSRLLHSRHRLHRRLRNLIRQRRQPASRQPSLRRMQKSIRPRFVRVQYRLENPLSSLLPNLLRIVRHRRRPVKIIHLPRIRIRTIAWRQCQCQHPLLLFLPIHHYLLRRHLRCHRPRRRFLRLHRPHRRRRLLHLRHHPRHRRHRQRQLQLRILRNALPPILTNLPVRPTRQRHRLPSLQSRRHLDLRQQIHRAPIHMLIPHLRLQRLRHRPHNRPRTESLRQGPPDRRRRAQPRIDPVRVPVRRMLQLQCHRHRPPRHHPIRRRHQRRLHLRALRRLRPASQQPTNSKRIRLLRHQRQQPSTQQIQDQRKLHKFKERRPPPLSSHDSPHSGSFACDPSQNGSFPECLHAHIATVFSSVSVNFTGASPVPLCDPSQNGWVFERPHEHHQ